MSVRSSIMDKVGELLTSTGYVVNENMFDPFQETDLPAIGYLDKGEVIVNVSNYLEHTLTVEVMAVSGSSTEHLDMVSEIYGILLKDLTLYGTCEDIRPTGDSTEYKEEGKKISVTTIKIECGYTTDLQDFDTIAMYGIWR